MGLVNRKIYELESPEGLGGSSRIFEGLGGSGGFGGSRRVSEGLGGSWRVRMVWEGQVGSCRVWRVQ